MKPSTLTLKGRDYSDLFHSAGISQLDNDFLHFLQTASPQNHALLLAYRESANILPPEKISDLLIDCAHVLEQFLIALFDIQTAADIAQVKTIENNPISIFKKYFVLKRAKKEIHQKQDLPPFATLNKHLDEALANAAFKTQDKELAISLLATEYLTDPDIYKTQIENLVTWCISVLTTDEGKAYTAHWTSFHIPLRVDHAHLVPTISLNPTISISPSEDWRERDGFKLTDERMNAREVQDEVNYCIYCHDHLGDFCSKGFPVKKNDPSLGFKKNLLNLTMTGCPLEEKISEAHYLKKDGHTLASLAMIMIDNPMCPATGHRICNDCMKACVFQKQEPVNIPQIETRILTDVLALPWGVEIYDLLTRWNPLRSTQWAMKAYNGKKILIAGMGPAGFTLAHHLLLEGFAVVGFDGLKIEPLAENIIRTPIYDFNDLKENLDERVMAGFGGVAEYGITVRWDKNFLKLIYLSLMRRPYFQVFGSVRFGGTVTVDDAWDMGFDHLAIAVGAGLPKALSVPGSLAPGMRQANDFLMALQLGNAAKADSLTSLQIRLPAVIIGGGLTGVDTATEVQAYYIKQVEKVLARYETLVNVYGEENIAAQFEGIASNILHEYLMHGKAVRAERERAAKANQPPELIKLIHNFGGVTIAYRRSMQESPAYVNNHEELKKAMEEGIYYAESLEPHAVLLDHHGHVETLVCHKRVRNEQNEWVSTTELVNLPARSILVATGTQPNTAYEFEYKGTFNRVNLQYQHYEEDNGALTIAHGVTDCKDNAFGPFTSYQKDDKRVSLIGDTHPVFHGNVVKAIASGLKTYPKIVALFKDKMHAIDNYSVFAEKMQHVFSASVKHITRLNHDTLELCIKAPLAAQHFKAGQFYRLQNYETFAPKIADTLLQMEPLAVTAAMHDEAEDTLSFIIKEHSTAEKLCHTFKVGDPVALMGPTGVRAKIGSAHETILIIGDVSSYAFLLAYGRELKHSENQVIYLLKLNQAEELILQDQLESATDAIIWLTESDELISANRAQDIALKEADVVSALKHYVDANKETSAPKLSDVDRVYIVGDVNLLRHVQSLRATALNEIFLKQVKYYGSVYGNMQCMLKGVCAQCLQWQIDPETGQRTKAVFACSWQDQPLEIIDMDHLAARREQNVMHETLNQLWLKHIVGWVSPEEAS